VTEHDSSAEECQFQNLQDSESIAVFSCFETMTALLVDGQI
jgi:hypothetical protein